MYFVWGSVLLWLAGFESTKRREERSKGERLEAAGFSEEFGGSYGRGQDQSLGSKQSWSQFNEVPRPKPWGCSRSKTGI